MTSTVLLIGIIVLYILPNIFNYLEKYYYIKKIISKIYNLTRQKGKIVDSLKYYGLIIYIAIPLPFTGVWTGALAAHLFGLSKKKSLIAVFMGALISGILVTILTKTGLYYFVEQV